MKSSETRLISELREAERAHNVFLEQREKQKIGQAAQLDPKYPFDKLIADFGEKAPIASTERRNELLRLLYKNPLESGLSSYLGSDHGSWVPTYNNIDCWTWMFSQRKSSGVDTTPPAISIATPTNGSTWTTTNPLINLAGIASDNVGVTQVSWTNDRGGSGVAGGTGNWSINNIALQLGVNTLSVTAQDAANNRSSATLQVTLNPVPAVGGGLNGLNAEYYNSAALNGQLLIDNWTSHPMAENAGNITLQAGQKYDIKMEYFENTGAAVARLLWSSASQAKEIVPSSQVFPDGNGLTGEYFNTVDLTGPVLIRSDATVNFDWAYGSPDASLNADFFSVRWVGKVMPKYSENYTFYTLSDDGVRLWVNGQLLIDNWTVHPSGENSGNISLQAGQKYDIRMEYFENWGAAVAKLSWSSPSQAKEIVPESQLFPSGTGLNVQYFNNMALSSTALERIDATVNFDWGNGSPAATISADGISARWGGKVQPLYTESYTFSTVTDDGVRLWVNGQLLIDDWSLHGATEKMGSISLQAGQKYDIKMEWFENSGLAVAKLSWQSARQAKEIIPQSQLYAASSNTSSASLALTAHAKNSILALDAGDASGATAVPSEAAVGQVVAFTAPAIDAEGISFAWNFGDGTAADGASVSHSFAAEGTYAAIVTITDANGGTSTSSVTVSVLERKPIKVKKLQVSLDFKNSGNDSIAILGSLPVAKNFAPAGKQAFINVGGVTKSFMLNSKGVSQKGANSFKLTRTKKSGSDAQFHIRLKGGSFGADLEDEGLLNVDGKNQIKIIGLSISIDDAKYATNLKALYSSVKGKTGRAK